MKLINRLADRALNRLVPESRAEAAECPQYKCSEYCYRMCCPGKPCAPCWCL